MSRPIRLLEMDVFVSILLAFFFSIRILFEVKYINMAEMISRLLSVGFSYFLEFLLLHVHPPFKFP